MTSVVWALADALGIVPSPPDARLVATLTNWWSRPRLIGCPMIKADPAAPWVVVAPDPTVLCGACAASRYEQERRCVYCHSDVHPDDDIGIVHEMQGGAVTVVAHAHVVCNEGQA